MTQKWELIAAVCSAVLIFAGRIEAQGSAPQQRPFYQQYPQSNYVQPAQTQSVNYQPLKQQQQTVLNGPQPQSNYAPPAQTQSVNYQPQQQQQQQPVLTKPEPPRGYPQFQYDAASVAVTDLARRIGSVLGQQSDAGIFSPVSIACALSLLLLGAENETKRELQRVLGFSLNERDANQIHKQYGRMLRELSVTTPDRYPALWRVNDRCTEDDDEDYRPEPQIIHLANALFVNNDVQVNNNFKAFSRGFYNTSVNSMDFASNPQRSAYLINKWASDNTYGKIDQIVSSYISPDTQMLVANALYFKGLWKEAFEVQATTNRKFYPDGYENPSTAKEVLTMAVIGCYPYYDAVELGAKIVGLPYQGDKTAMYIVIPNNSNRQNLQQFQRTLTAEQIGYMVAKMTARKALIQMPKMKISNTINLRDVLQRLKLQSIFNPATSDLSGMLQTTVKTNGNRSDPEQIFYPHNQRLYASEIIHKVELEINEKGTEGGAVTASTIFRSLPSVQVRIDVPFLIVLGHDSTRLPLFYGSVYDPTG